MTSSNGSKATPSRSLLRENLVGKLRAETFDLLVIGGGATGTGIALEAACRGLKIALVEKNDFASGTSSRSTKLIHGGVGYLEKAVRELDRGQFNLVRDALRERSVLLRIAPHLANSIPLVVPLYRAWQVPYYWVGLKIYDALAGKGSIGSSRFLRTGEALERCPILKPERLLGAVLYYDGQFDDARMNLAIAVTAINHGAVVVNHVEVTSLVKETGRVTGAQVQDKLTGDRWEIRANTLINATGPFADQVRKLDDPHAEPMLSVSSGVHVVLKTQFDSPDAGLLIPETEDGRVLFVLPWLGNILIGTTDNPTELSEHPQVRGQEIDYLLHHVNMYSNLQVTRADVQAAWSGIRPLVAVPDAKDTARLSRDHVIVLSASNLITITGGKWTTYRKMAEDAMNFAVRHCGLRRGSSCSTDQIRLVGGARYGPQTASRLATAYSLDTPVAANLQRAYGDRAEEVGAIAAQGLDGRLAPAYPYIEAEVIWAARQELAQTALDVLARRTRLAFLDPAAAIEALPRVVELLAEELGWDEARRRSEAETYRQLGRAL